MQPDGRAPDAGWRSRRGRRRASRWSAGRSAAAGSRPTRRRPERLDSARSRVGLAAGDWCGFGGAAEAPGDQREDDARSLTFDSAPLAERLEILGAPVVTLELAVDRPAAQLAVRLNDVTPDGSRRASPTGCST